MYVCVCFVILGPCYGTWAGRKPATDRQQASGNHTDDISFS